MKKNGVYTVHSSFVTQILVSRDGGWGKALEW
jgi:hypothetical protein